MYLYTLLHPEHRLVFYKPQLVNGNLATSTLESCNGAVQHVRHIEAFAKTETGQKPKQKLREGLPGPDGCVLGPTSWAQVPALQAAHAQYPDADYIVWHDGDAIINPDYFDQSLHKYLQSLMPLDVDQPSQPIMLNLEQGNWWCSQTIQADAPCFNVGTIVIHGHRDPRVTEWLDAWWNTAVEAQDTPPANIKQRESFMGNSKGLMMTVTRARFEPWIMRAPPGFEDPKAKTAELATQSNGYRGLWRFEGHPYPEPKEKGEKLPLKLVCPLLSEFLPSTADTRSWTGTTEKWTLCQQVKQCRCAPASRGAEACGNDLKSENMTALLIACVQGLRPVPAVCLTGMPNFNCFMHHFYSSGRYKKYWSDRLSTLVHKHTQHAFTCDGMSPLSYTKEGCLLYRSLFDPVDGNRMSVNETLHSLAVQIEPVITFDLPHPDWV